MEETTVRFQIHILSPETVTACFGLSIYFAERRLNNADRLPRSLETLMSAAIAARPMAKRLQVNNLLSKYTHSLDGRYEK